MGTVGEDNRQKMRKGFPRAHGALDADIDSPKGGKIGLPNDLPHTLDVYMEAAVHTGLVGDELVDWYAPSYCSKRLTRLVQFPWELETSELSPCFCSG